MKQLALLVMVALIPLSGMCKESYVGYSPVQEVGGQVYALSLLESSSEDSPAKVAIVRLVIGRAEDRRPIPSSNIQRMQFVDTDGRQVEFRSKNPGEIQADNSMGGLVTFVATYELVNAAMIQRIRKVVFRYLDKEVVLEVTKSVENRAPE